MNIQFEKETPRLILRPYCLSDFEVWRDTFANLSEAQNEWDTSPIEKESLTRKKFNEILENQEINRSTDTFYELIAFEKETSKIIGGTSLMDISRGIFQNAYLGYSVLNSYWGQGFGKELAKYSLEIGFNELKVHRIEAGIDPNNIRSVRLAESLGMRKEGLSKKRLLLNNEWSDMLIYAITIEEFN